jgi:hypothetical protein
MSKESKPKHPSMSDLLKAIETEALDKGKYNIPKEGFFRCAMRASFVRSYQFAAYCHRIKYEKADEGCFFMASALRGSCEDLIALKFIRQLPRKLRDELMTIEMMLAVNKAVLEQTKFFRKERPFQDVIRLTGDPAQIDALKERRAEIGRTSGLWNPGKDKKVPPMEQMAIKLGMREMYDYFYRVTSDVVHFNPRISLRSGWGDDPKRGKFSAANFARYYLGFCQTYSVMLFTMMARTFAVELTLSKEFRAGLTALEETIDNELRWPEAVTFEEMNRKPPSIILVTLARVMWDDPKERRKWKRVLSKAGKASKVSAAAPSTATPASP